MDISRRSTQIYGLLLVLWVLVVGWQVEEHVRVREAAKTELRGRADVIKNFLSATIRGQRFGSTVLQPRLEPVLELLVNGQTNELTRPSELLGITLLNSAGDSVISAGQSNLTQTVVEGEYWGPDTVTFVAPVPGVSFAEGTNNNSIVVLPPPGTNEMRRREFPHPEPPDSPGNVLTTNTNGVAEVHPPHDGDEPPPPPPPQRRRRTPRALAGTSALAERDER